MSLTDRPLGVASKAEQKEQQQREAEEQVWEPPACTCCLCMLPDWPWHVQPAAPHEPLQRWHNVGAPVTACSAAQCPAQPCCLQQLGS
jgi:hypothetical protein